MRDTRDVNRTRAGAGREPETSGRATDGAGGETLPDDVVDDAERLTRLAREAIDENERDAYRERRADLLAEHGYAARVREADDTLVCHPAEWLADGTVRTDRIEDLSRAVEVSLSGPGDPDDWDALDARNRELVATVREEYGEIHGANADALADFMGNHYAKPIADATGAELEEFLGEYFVRNAWPSARQRATVGRSVALCFEAADEPVPSFSVPERLQE
ncbi:rnhA operon protein [Halovivax sp.]|uniref:DUF7108 domain-containing protein n=1 Tax=Halovivax sp. TaxID=1935978 RepID=UPI0025C52CB3|nr:rnhA operon protein [Halovivax sp.]